MLKGRLGLETARVPQSDRHGLLWLGRGKLSVSEGCLKFATTGVGELEAGVYQIPFQGLSHILLGPGCTVSHDALRLLARHQTGLIATGRDGVRFYASMPFGPDDSTLSRKQVTLWAKETTCVAVAKKMYKIRMGSTPRAQDLNVLRGLEGKRMKAVYKRLATQYGIAWQGRRYDRQDPDQNDDINHAINHAATATTASAMIAVAVTGAIPQLGFIHEASGRAFALDIMDLFRASVTLPVAFASAAEKKRRPHMKIERITRRKMGERMKEERLVGKMIDAIKEVMDVDDDPGDA